MKKLPLSIFTFKNIIEEGYLYVDKTEEVYKLINSQKYAFLSRPRRFGKSLLVSTLEALFLGRRDLFEGLWIEDKIKWETYPVVRIDFSKVVASESKDFFHESLVNIFSTSAARYSISLESKHAAIAFQQLTDRLHLQTGKKVVILIDEYDSPITNQLVNLDKADENRKWLREFYAILKAQEELIHFVFITGISKYAKVSVFSVLNNMKDISANPAFNAIVGFTPEELADNFPEQLAALGAESGMQPAELMEEIQYWYNGYSWDGKNKIYNPFSIISLFDSMAFKNYWFQSGTPNLLIDFIMQKAWSDDLQQDPARYENIQVTESIFDSGDLVNLNLDSLLFQTGYLTITGTKQDGLITLYTLGYPNFEVRWSFVSHILEAYGQIPMRNVQPDALALKRHLRRGDMDAFLQLLRRFFALIPYPLREKADEAYYHSLFQLLLTLVGVKMEAEKITDKGRMDGVLELEDRVYVIEFKYARKGTLATLLKRAFLQIRRLRYHEPFLGGSRQVLFLAVAFLEKRLDKQGKKMLEIDCRLKNLQELEALT